MNLLDAYHPEESIYYKASFVLRILYEKPVIEYYNLLYEIKKIKKMTGTEFHYCLLWLYLIDLIKLDENFFIHLIKKK